MTRSLRTLAHAATIAWAACAVACGGRPALPSRGDPAANLSAPFAEAAEAEQTRGADAAIDAYLRLLDSALANAAAARANEAVLAALDALVMRTTHALDGISDDNALAHRHPGAMKRIAERLAAAYDRAAASGPFARPLLAEAAMRLAEHEGNTANADLWRKRVGCARSAAVIGPLAWPPVSGVRQPTALDVVNTALPAKLDGVGPFAAASPAVTVRADGCDLDLVTTSVLDGVRAVVVDIEVPSEQTIGVVLESTSAAALTLGGRPAIARGYELGGGAVARWATAHVTAGRLRAVARVGSNGDGSRVRLAFLGQDGVPLVTHAPAVGDAAALAPSAVIQVAVGAKAASEAERALVAAGQLALGESRAAEHMLEEQARSKGSSALVKLLYARAVQDAADLPENRLIERAREALESVLQSWPTAWEPLLAHAELTARRRGSSEGRIEALRELAARRSAHPKLDPMVNAYEAALAAQSGLFDQSERAFQSARPALQGAPLFAELDDSVHERIGPEKEQQLCRTDGIDRSSLRCLDAKVDTGDRRGALAEIARVRGLRGAPDALKRLELQQFVALGDEAGVRKIYDAMLPAERTLAALALLLPRGSAELKTRVMSDLISAADSPGALVALSAALLDSSAPALEAEGSARVAADRKTRSMTNAATAVLRHIERYTIGDGGLLRYTLYDLRRVSGTTDVEQGAQSAAAMVDGRDVRRVVRRRIHKTDGRVLEPDKASYASQEHADLSQLEKGDYVEQIVEGWALPGASGHLVVDTPDLLPERTSVDEASVEVRRPQGLALQVWAHALWGKASDRIDGAQKVTRYEMHQRAPRRIEEGVPKMDRDVAVSFGTVTWQLVGRSIGEAIAVLGDRDPYVSQWARKTAQGKPEGPRAMVERIAIATGKAVKVASGASLSDSTAAYGAGAQLTNARTILELGQGSRSWLAYRALAEMGIGAEIVVAEREPFSADPTFPAHFGRFDYPLVIAHLPDGDVWLDLDVQGPPLPAGRVSPELRGRVAMNAAGSTLAVGGVSAGETRDDIDLRLRVDGRGDASGSFTIVLRGRTAQALADALERVVGTDRSDLLRGVVLGWIPWANVDEVGLSSSEGSWEVALRAAVTIPGYAQAQGGGWVIPGLEPLHAGFPRPYVSTLGATFASRGARESALAIDDAFQYQFRRRIELGTNVTLAGALPSVDVRDENLEASRRGKLEAGVLDEQFSLSVPTGTLDVPRYREFADKAHQVDDAFQAAVRVGVPAGAGAARREGGAAP